LPIRGLGKKPSAAWPATKAKNSAFKLVEREAALNYNGQDVEPEAGANGGSLFSPGLAGFWAGSGPFGPHRAGGPQLGGPRAAFCPGPGGVCWGPIRAPGRAAPLPPRPAGRAVFLAPFFGRPDFRAAGRPDARAALILEAAKKQVSSSSTDLASATWPAPFSYSHYQNSFCWYSLA